MKKALDAVGGFKIEHRGLVDVKVIRKAIIRYNVYRSFLTTTDSFHITHFRSLRLNNNKDK